jgi:hypothetical protein
MTAVSSLTALNTASGQLIVEGRAGERADDGREQCAESASTQTLASMSVFGMNTSETALLQAALIMLITLLLITTSIITIVVIWSNEGLRDVMGYYMTSLAISDLING